MLWAGQLLKLKLLIDSDADIDAPSEYYSQRGWTPAMALTMNEAYDEVLYLVCNVARTYSTTLTFRKALRPFPMPSPFMCEGTESTLLKHGIRVSHRCAAGRYSHRES